MTSSQDPWGEYQAGQALPYSQPVYPDSGTGTASVPAYPPYPQAYPQAYPPAGFPPGYVLPPGYQLVPVMPFAPVRPPRPAAATASAVLQFVQSGLVAMGSLVLLIPGSFDSWNFSSEFTVLGVLALLCMGLLIGGGVTMMSGRLPLTVAGCVLSLGISVYIAIRLSGFTDDGEFIAPVLYAVLPIIALAMGCSGDVRRWGLDRRTH